MENLAANSTTDIFHLHEQTTVHKNFSLNLQGGKCIVHCVCVCVCVCERDRQTERQLDRQEV